MKKVWRLIAKALGEKSGSSNSEADVIALIRLLLLLLSLGLSFYGAYTNYMIVKGIERHWDDK